ncbi:hypothetical protein K2173_014706 [Erythroxylum novogranatense]|uniref:Pentatricopeptide repeat-containing protein n=1 Tax=Erythroxylum novogranatense TaxID=1862640 RepID=A0AAV8THW2_9ROSI|nr:hypothetical protein K2173_014706 [Erythroxylum novogranatense]
MEAPVSSSNSQPPRFEPNVETIKRRLLKKGVYPTPKIIHTLRKKEIQKHNRKLNKTAKTQQCPPLTPAQKQALDKEFHFETLKNEYRDFTSAIETQSSSSSGTCGLLVGRPWERIEKVKLREIAGGSNGFYGGTVLKRQNLRDLKQVFEDDLRWVLDNDIEFEDGSWLNDQNQPTWDPTKRKRSEKEAIGFLVARLSNINVTARDWKLGRIMKQCGLLFTERQMLRIVEGLGEKGKWEQALAVVEWMYGDKRRRDCKSKYVYTKLLSILGKEQKSQEALRIFNLMREDRDTYPDMAAYHSISVTLGQAGLLKELIKVIECMRQKPFKRTKNLYYKNWDPVLDPDLVIYNAVLNACIPTQQWKGVSWVFKQLRKSGLKPNAATYGLAMEVMLNSGKHDLVHKLFEKMNRSGETSKALTYKVLVKTFWGEGRITEAVEAVREMERRGVVGTASVYYELACCLCYNGRWQDAILEVQRIKKLRHNKPLEVSFTGMIVSALEAGHIDDCKSIFEHMKSHCVPNIGTINIMLKVYGQNDLFSKAKELFEEIKGVKDVGTPLVPDVFTYSSMLEASARALQWEYFEYVYKEMVFQGYPMNQSKLALLLVKASRAGKFHLLEHAFDAILEAGEIPYPLMFTEMVLQATSKQEFARAVSLVNAIAYAPFRVSERQWIDLFERNAYRVSRDSLSKLLDSLGTCEVTSEDTFSNLSRALHSLCGSGTSKELASLVTFDTQISHELHCNATKQLAAVDKEENGTTSAATASAADDNSEIDASLFSNRIDVETDMFPLDDYQSYSDLTNVTDEISSPQISGSDPDETTSSLTNMEIFVEDMATGESTECLDKKFPEFPPARYRNKLDEELKIPVNDDSGSNSSKLPSAYEILNTWKISR